MFRVGIDGEGVASVDVFGVGLRNNELHDEVGEILIENFWSEVGNDVDVVSERWK